VINTRYSRRIHLNKLHPRIAVHACMCLAMISTALAARAEPMLKLTWTVDDQVRSEIIPLPAPGKVVELGKMNQVPFDPTSGDCSRADTSTLPRSYPEGDVLRVRSTPATEQGAIVQVQFEFVRLDGTSTSSVGGCNMHFGITSRRTGNPKVFLSYGRSTTLLYERNEESFIRPEAQGSMQLKSQKSLAKIEAQLLR
jgi:hypothetical protein